MVLAVFSLFAVGLADVRTDRPHGPTFSLTPFAPLSLVLSFRTTLCFTPLTYSADPYSLRTPLAGRHLTSEGVVTLKAVSLRFADLIGQTCSAHRLISSRDIKVSLVLSAVLTDRPIYRRTGPTSRYADCIFLYPGSAHSTLGVSATEEKTTLAAKALQRYLDRTPTDEVSRPT